MSPDWATVLVSVATAAVLALVVAGINWAGTRRSPRD